MGNQKARAFSVMIAAIDAESKLEVVADILAAIKERRG